MPVTFDDKYAETFDHLFYSKTNEKEIVTNLLQKHFVNRSIGNALDIGAGPGTITRVLDQFAAKLTIIEANPAYKTTLSRQFPNSTLIVDMFDNVQLTKQFDVILMNQCLYYIQAEKWFTTCQKAFSACAIGGEIIIILNDHNAVDLARIFSRYAELRQHFQWHYMSIDDLECQLKSLGDMTILPYSYVVIYKDAQEFANGLLHAALDLDSKELIEKTRSDALAFAEQFRNPHGDYVINIDAKIICCTK